VSDVTVFEVIRLDIWKGLLHQHLNMVIQGEL